MIDFDITSMAAPAEELGFVRGERFRRKEREQELRMAKFLAANKLKFTERTERLDYPGNIFESLRFTDHWGKNIFRLSDSPRIEFGEVEHYVVKTLVQTSYIAIELPRRLPNIVLDATSNQMLGVSNLPNVPHASQRLSLEGDFDKTFRLFCPAGYERDALYLFTPDIMAHLMDTAGAFDVEIVDNWAILSTHAAWDKYSADGWRRRFEAVNAILTKVGQWDRWRSDQISTGVTMPEVELAVLQTEGVGKDGQRLRGSSGTVGCLMTTAILLGGVVLLFGLILLPAFLQGNLRF